MTISIQGSSAAALATLDQLAGQSGTSATATAPTADSPSADAGALSSAFIDLSGLSPGALGGASGDAASGASIADAAVASGSIIEGLLAQMRDAAVSASDPGISSDARAALNGGFQSGLTQIQAAIGAAGVDGVNLIDGSANGQAPDGLSSYDFSLGDQVIGVAASASLSDPATAASLADQLQAALGNVGQAVSTLAGEADTMQSSFAASAQAGSGSVDPALDADGARLAALLVQQQLSSGGGAIGNQGSAAILALFR